MELQFTVSVKVDPLDSEMQARLACAEHPATATDVVRDEILSNLHSVSYVRECSVRPLAMERAARVRAR